MVNFWALMHLYASKVQIDVTTSTQNISKQYCSYMTTIYGIYMKLCRSKDANKSSKIYKRKIDLKKNL